MKLLVKNGRIFDGKSATHRVSDILIEDGIVVEIDNEIDSTGCEIIDAKEMYVLPGLVDAHCHLRDPGFEYKEDIESGTRSAAKGGFTSIACMPNTNPVLDNEAMIMYILNKAKTDGIVNVYPIGAVSKGLKGEELSEIGEIKFAGAVALSDDGRPVNNSALMKKAMQYASTFDITIISHCEDLDLVDEGLMNEGYYSSLLGLKGNPAPAEEVMIARDLILAEYTKAYIHIAHVSTELGVDLIRNAKRRGVNVTAETCPHYFALTEQACEGFNTNAKVNPPLRTQKDAEAIIEGLKDGTIDIISTDHAPHHLDEKNVEFKLAANGMVGFETAFPLAITYLVKPGHLTIEELVKKMCVNPSKMLGLNKGTIELGKSADILIFDINEQYTVDISTFESKSKNSPFNGFKLYGQPQYTIVGGNPIVREKVLL